MNQIQLAKIPDGQIIPPPSKSISHRALICAALAKGESRITNLDVEGEDVSATLSCLKSLGAPFFKEGDAYLVEGGIQHNQEARFLDCKESGSSLRFLIPIALLSSQKTSFIGSGRLMERPLEPFLKVLRDHGGEGSLDAGVLTVRGPIKPGRYELPGDISSQFVSGLLFALPLLASDSEIRLTSPLESKSYVDLTRSVMKAFGVEVEEVDGFGYLIPGNQAYTPTSYAIEGDYSGAAFFLVAGALGCEVECLGLNPDSLQGDRAILDLIEKAGGRITTSESLGLRATAESLSPITVDIRDIPDLGPPLVSLLCFSEGESRIVGAKRLRLKESDRLHALTTQMNALGADIFEGEDYLVIRGMKELKGGRVDPQGDHRIAMAAAIASLRCKGDVWIENPECVNKSYPNFWKDFSKIDRR